MAVVEAQRISITTSSFNHATRQPVTASGSEQKYPPSLGFKHSIRLPVTAKGSDQKYPALSPSKRGIKVAVIAQGTKLVLAEAANSIRKITKLFGQLFP